MKKYIGIVFVLITILSLTACGSNGSNKKIVLPKAEEIKEIEIMKNTSEEILKIENKEEISGIIEDIKENTKGPFVASCLCNPWTFNVSVHLCQCYKIF